MKQFQVPLFAALIAACVAMSALGISADAVAQDIHAEPPPIQPPQSPIHGVVGLDFGQYKPGIDKEFGGDGPYQTMFGKGGLLTELSLQWHLYQGVGKVAIGGSLGFFNKKGSAFNEAGEKTADRTALLVVPLRLSLIYRFDYLQERFRVPFVIAVKAGLDYSFWNVKNAGKIADGAASDGRVFVGRGGTAGWHYGVTLYFWLNWLAPAMAASFDGNTGINNSYLYAEFLSTHMNNFGGKNSWDLSDNIFKFGLAFEF